MGVLLGWTFEGRVGECLVSVSCLRTRLAGLKQQFLVRVQVVRSGSHEWRVLMDQLWRLPWEQNRLDVANQALPGDGVSIHLPLLGEEVPLELAVDFEGGVTSLPRAEPSEVLDGWEASLHVSRTIEP